jgi:hypothetical protein
MILRLVCRLMHWLLVMYHYGDNRREEMSIEEANYAALKYRGPVPEAAAPTDHMPEG